MPVRVWRAGRKPSSGVIGSTAGQVVVLESTVGFVESGCDPDGPTGPREFDPRPSPQSTLDNQAPIVYSETQSEPITVGKGLGSRIRSEDPALSVGSLAFCGDLWYAGLRLGIHGRLRATSLKPGTHMS